MGLITVINHQRVAPNSPYCQESGYVPDIIASIRDDTRPFLCDKTKDSRTFIDVYRWKQFLDKLPRLKSEPSMFRDPVSNAAYFVCGYFMVRGLPPMHGDGYRLVFNADPT